MAVRKNCFKCGKEKIALAEAGEGHASVQMVRMGYGKNKGSFFCRDCSETGGRCPNCNKPMTEHDILCNVGINEDVSECLCEDCLNYAYREAGN